MNCSLSFILSEALQTTTLGPPASTEFKSTSSSSMLSPRLRNGKQRMLVFILVGAIFLLGIYVLRDTHIKLNEARSLSERCQQQHESLSAQLQVVYEHKSRLDKSLQQEKADHKKTKDDLQSQYQELQYVHDKEKQELGNRFDSLQQQEKMLQNQNEDLQEELNKVQQSNIELKQEKQRLQNTLENQVELQKQKELEIPSLKSQILQLQQEIEQVNKEMDTKNWRIQDIEVQLKKCQSTVGISQTLKSNAGNQLKENGKIENAVEKAAKPIATAAQSPRQNELPRKLPSLGLAINQDMNGQRKNVIHQSDLEKDTGSKRELSNNLQAIGDAKPLKKPQSKRDFLERLQEGERQQAEAGKDLGALEIVGQPHQQLQPPLGLGYKEMAGGRVRKEPDSRFQHQPQLDSQFQNQPHLDSQLQNQPHLFDVDEGHQIAEPDSARLNVKPDSDTIQLKAHAVIGRVPVGREEEFQGNGLEQQENGEDQDLDNMEDDVLGNQQRQPPDEGKAFEDADFDQIDQLGDDGLGAGNIKKGQKQ